MITNVRTFLSNILVRSTICNKKLSLLHFLRGFFLGLLGIFFVSTDFFSIKDINYTELAVFFPFMLKKKDKYFLSLFLILFTIGFTIIVYQNTLLILIAMIFFSILPGLSLLIVTPFEKISQKAKSIIDSFLYLLYTTDLLKIAFTYYCWLNNKLSYFQFKIYAIFVHLLLLFYILVARYVFLLKINFQAIPPYILVLFFLASCGLIFRGFTTFSWSIIPFVFTYYPSYGRLLIPLDSDIPSSEGSSNNPNSGNMSYYGGFLPRHNHTHHHYHPPVPPKSNFYKNFGLTLGVIGCGCSIFACYVYNKSANATVAQAIEAKRQADAAVKAADATAVSAGVLSKESYYERYPSDRPQK